jgi:sRNA-binding carbon storage regulator CsrA
MLKITRRPGEGITLFTSDGEIHITYERLNSSKQIKLTIDAPDEVKIWRDELLDGAGLD